MPCPKLLEFLSENNVDFELHTHPSAYAAQDVAFKAGVPGRLFAKTVLVKLDGKMAMAVLPADSKVDFHLLRETAGAETITLAVEDEFEELFPDCEPGAVPPLGPAYQIETFLDEAITSLANVYFEAGDHEHLVHISGNDFKTLLSGVRHGHYSHDD